MPTFKQEMECVSNMALNIYLQCSKDVIRAVWSNEETGCVFLGLELCNSTFSHPSRMWCKCRNLTLRKIQFMCKFVNNLIAG
jgi:hypothetical protein